MHRFTRSAASFLLANLTLLSCAQAAGQRDGGPEATLTWRLEFGAREWHHGYALALGYRPASADQPAGELLAVDVSDRAALARLAGVPLADRKYRADQNEAGANPDEPAAKPWYTRQWVWWTLGGVASTVALAGAGGSEYSEGGSVVISGGPNGCSGGGNVGPADVPETCTEGGTVVGTDDDGNVCVVEGFGNPEDVCAPTGGFAGPLSSRFVSRLDTARLDAGTGGMGDLVELP